MFAIINIYNKFYKVYKNDIIKIYLKPSYSIGEIISINKISMVSDKYSTIIGNPFLNSYKVYLEIQEWIIDAKYKGLKKKKRKCYNKLLIKRQIFYILKVINIDKNIITI